MGISRSEAPVAEHIRDADTAVIDDLQENAARSADRIDDFRTQFRDDVEEALAVGDIQNKTMADDRIDVVEDVTRGQEDIRLATMHDAHILGQNTIGAGREGMRLNRGMMHDIDSLENKTTLKQVIAHEEAHGRQVRLKGELEVEGEKVDHTLLYEGHAEILGNEGANMSISDHREGQPDALYAEGQDLAQRIINKVGRDTYERVMTQTGDLNKLAV